MSNIKKPTKEDIKDIEKEALGVVSNCSLIVSSKEELQVANERLGSIKDIKNKVKERKESITKPLNEAKKNTLDFFRPIEEKINDAEKNIKGAILNYKQSHDAHILERKRELLNQLEKDKITQDELSSEMEKINAKLEGVTTRSNVKIEVVSEKDIPRIYLKPNMEKIKKDINKGKQIKGIKVYDEEIIINK